MVMVGVCGHAPEKEFVPWDVEYSWVVSGLGRKIVAPLHKLKRPAGVPNRRNDACYDAIADTVSRLSGDTVGKRHGRVLQLLNEPDNHGESNWGLNPRIAADWCADMMRHVRPEAPWVKFAGPNLFLLGRDGRDWLDSFFEALLSHGEALDIYAVHGYSALWYGVSSLTGHLAEVRQRFDGHGMASGYPVWISEIGSILSGTTVAMVKADMSVIESYHRAYGEGLSIEAWLWYLTYDGDVANSGHADTMLYTGRSPDSVETPAGQKWHGIWKRLSRGQ